VEWGAVPADGTGHVYALPAVLGRGGGRGCCRGEISGGGRAELPLLPRRDFRARTRGRAGYPTVGIMARRGRGARCLAREGDARGACIAAGGRRTRGVHRGRGHGEVVDALRPPLRISRD
jgi:hypothetical protein